MRDANENQLNEGPQERQLLPLMTRELCFATPDGKCLIDRLNLAIGADGLTVIMGPNGAGKSLLLRLLHGLIEPTDGEIIWGGQALDAATRKRQALVFQRPVLLRRSVAANLEFALSLNGRPVPGRCDELLDAVGLLAHARQPARLLSGGEQQRLTLARALAMEPDVLFLDEPTASLDPASTAMIEKIARATQEQGRKVIFVTHDIAQARRLADDVVFLHDGRLEETAPADAFFEKPQSAAAQAYLNGRIDF